MHGFKGRILLLRAKAVGAPPKAQRPGWRLRYRRNLAETHYDASREGCIDAEEALTEEIEAGMKMAGISYGKTRVDVPCSGPLKVAAPCWSHRLDN